MLVNRRPIRYSFDMCQYFRPRWWLVPNLLALDAPLVAVVWQRFLANQSAVVVAWTASVALAATVWCIYLADRWLDARRGAVDADRHRIAARWPMAFGILFVVAASTAAVFAIQLPIAYTECGVVVGFGVGVYLALVHIGVLRAVNGAKEFLVKRMGGGSSVIFRCPTVGLVDLRRGRHSP